MGLFDFFRKSRQSSSSSSEAPRNGLPHLAYQVAYFILPHYAHKNLDKVISLWRDTPQSAGPFFYFMSCQMKELEPVPEDASKFRAHAGQLDEANDYFVLEYPVPPKFDLPNLDIASIEGERMPVLAPYFSAIVMNRNTRAVQYFVLGQAPIGGGTTLRAVSPDGLNMNLGAGPEPNLDTFLSALLKGQSPIAAHRPPAS